MSAKPAGWIPELVCRCTRRAVNAFGGEAVSLQPGCTMHARPKPGQPGSLSNPSPGQVEALPDAAEGELCGWNPWCTDKAVVLRFDPLLRGWALCCLECMAVTVEGQWKP